MTIKKALTLVLIALPIKGISKDFYIDPSGDDRANGLSSARSSNNGPFKTLARAQKAVRDLKASGDINEPVIIHIQSGIYRLEKSLDFDVRDAGRAGQNITWQGENGPALISGGISLQKCNSDGKTWSCSTKNQKLGQIKYPQNYRQRGNNPGFELFIDNSPMHPARWPNSDWAHIRQPLDERTQFTSIETLPTLSKDSSQAQIHIMAGNDWHDQYLGVKSIEPDLNKISLSSNTNYKIESGRRFYLLNIKSLLDAPGEWFYDNNSEIIYFIPPTSAQPNEITVSTVNNIFNINGANNIYFKNLSLGYSTDTAIKLNNSNNISFDNLEISNVAGKAVEAKDSSFISVINSHIHHTGWGGITFSGGNRNTLERANNIAHNNHIHDFGRVVMTYTPAIETSGVGSSITHNLIEQSPGTGILLFGNEHLVEKNEIHHVCEQASDCGAIYSGRDWTFRGNIIRNNSIHDLFGYGLVSVDIANNFVKYARPDGVRGVYLDDSVSGFNVIGNIFRNAGVMAIQLGGGRDNIIENNIISTSDYAIWVDSRPAGDELKKRLFQVPIQSPVWLDKYPKLALPIINNNLPEGNSIRRNVMLSNKPGNILIRYQMPESTNILERNLLWSSSGSFVLNYDISDRTKKRNGATWQEWVNEGIEHGSIYGDPCLSITGNQANFCDKTLLDKIGFEVLPSDIGLISK
ncbi:right-handed parallel beta-helix repeat-containing protein [Methylomonas koyamae]|uniref:right-handed parallel beta-helix repeat-containing protein n=1 Tax=Methylomonas koyamae TaxID=702114 RepID=UPI001128D9E4|nr:right-handed parallel beta-helix repeat-containing protein [Methylomonas koyamae]TPQ25268.1 hypothetical protein C2U68_15695 [Methylomonas koyamae]